MRCITWQRGPSRNQGGPRNCNFEGHLSLVMRRDLVQSVWWPVPREKIHLKPKLEGQWTSNQLPMKEHGTLQPTQSEPSKIRTGGSRRRQAQTDRSWHQSAYQATAATPWRLLCCGSLDELHSVTHRSQKQLGGLEVAVEQRSSKRTTPSRLRATLAPLLRVKTRQQLVVLALKSPRLLFRFNHNKRGLSHFCVDFLADGYDEIIKTHTADLITISSP